MLQSRPMWARKVAPSGGYGAHPSVFQSSNLNSTGKKRTIVSCSSNSTSTKSTTSTLCDQKKSPPVSVLRKIRESLITGEKTAVEITEAYLAKLWERESYVKSFLHVSGEKAVQDAQELDKRIAEGLGDVGVLAGVPIGVKDNLCTRDMPSTGGSQILRGYCPPFDATAVAKLRSAGAILVGKTNMDEFGMGSSTEGSGYQMVNGKVCVYGTKPIVEKTNMDKFGMGSSTEGLGHQVTSNPWDLSRVPGGSSGGSAAAVAANQCAGALGSDTGGSIRQPASFCGVVGLKPSYGRVSRYGLMAYASSLDVVGCFGSSVLDAAILLGAVAGYDKHDSTSSPQEVPNYAATLLPVESLGSKPLAGVRFGIIRETIGDGVDEDVISAIRDAASHLESLGATVKEVAMPNFSLGLPAYYVLAPSEASSNLARYDGVRYGPRAHGEEVMSMYGNSRARGFGPEVKRRILMGTYALSAGYYDAFYKRAQQVRTLIQQDFKNAMQDVDLLLSPAAPTAAYKIGEKVNDPLSMYVGDLMTVNVNLAGLPALVVPCGLAKGGTCGLPVGLQMIGPAFGEETLLQLGHIFEQTLATSFSPPSLVG